MKHMGDHLLTVARWSLTGQLPSEGEINDAAEFGVAFPIRGSIDGTWVCIGMHLGEPSLTAGANRPRSISEVVDSLTWEAEGPGSLRCGAVGLPENGVAIYAPIADGRDRLGVLYSAVLIRDGFNDDGQVQVRARWATEPLPASVEAIRAKRRAGTWLDDRCATDS